MTMSAYSRRLNAWLHPSRATCQDYAASSIKPPRGPSGFTQAGTQRLREYNEIGAC